MNVKVKSGNFTLVNEGKVRRVIEGTTGASGQLIKGLGADADHEDIIAAYDRIGGLIRGKQNSKVVTGCFFDVHTKKMIENPKVVYEFRINSQRVFVDADKSFPFEVQAAQQLDEDKKEATKKKTKKTK